MKDCSHEPNMMIGDYHPSFQTIAASAHCCPARRLFPSAFILELILQKTAYRQRTHIVVHKSLLGVGLPPYKAGYCPSLYTS